MVKKILPHLSLMGIAFSCCLLGNGKGEGGTSRYSLDAGITILQAVLKYFVEKFNEKLN